MPSSCTRAVDHARHLTFAAGVIALVGAAAGGCAGGRAAQRWRGEPYATEPQRVTPTAVDADCARPGPALRGEPWRLALSGEIDPRRVPLAATASERHVFGNLYETLVRVDCEGTVLPGLATDWAAFAGGRVWIFRLRAGACYWDGTPVLAADVVQGWQRLAQRIDAGGQPSPFIAFAPDEGQVRAAGTDSLVFTLPEPTDALPLSLAHPDLAISRPGAGIWSLGSGPCRPADSTAAGAVVTLVPNPHHPRAPAWARVGIVTAGAGAVQSLAAGCQAVVTRDRQDAAAAARRRGARGAALPWDASFLLIVPPAAEDRDEQQRLPFTTGFNRRDLANALGDDARPAADLFFVQPRELTCAGLPVRVRPLVWPPFTWPEARASWDRDLVLYPADSAPAGLIARALAETAAQPLRPGRDIAGRGALTPDFPPAGGAAPQAVAVPPAEFLAALQSGRAGAYVLPWRHGFATACDQTGALLGLASWLQDAAWDEGIDGEIVPPSARSARPAATGSLTQPERLAQRLDQGRVVQTLVQVRAHLVTIAGLSGVTWDFAGTLDLTGACWTPESSAP